VDLSLALLLAAALFLAAMLYSSVGHGGASSYLAVMGLFGLSPAVIKPAALALNLIVSGIASFRFHQAGHLRWSLLWPFALASVPAAFVGGALTLPPTAYGVVVGAVLLYAAFRLAYSSRRRTEPATRGPPLPVALLVGSAIGFLSGLVGVGGGIFLSPLLLLAGWADAHRTAAASAVFIFVNSAAGLLGNLSVTGAIPAPLPLWAGAVALGGWIGATWGSRRVTPARLRQLLALVLVVAGIKFLFTG
jgi:uncharacterized protein